MSAVADKYSVLQKLGVEVISVSVDSHFVHKMWNDHELAKMVEGGVPFHMASDQAGNVGRAFRNDPLWFLDVRTAHHPTSHEDTSDPYHRVTHYYVGQLAYLAGRLAAMPEGDTTVLDNSCLMWLSNMWIGRKHDNTRLPLVLAGGLGGTLQTGRTLDYLQAGDENRKLSSLYLSLMDRFGVKLDRFGDATTRLERI